MASEIPFLVKAGIQGDFWFYLIKPQVRRLDGYTCQMCGSQKDLHTHHLSYKVQTIWTMITLCRTCHNLFHKQGDFGYAK